ncbi:hypothetical protein A2865_03250 [Candidatus Woesebacteria bacterium RIFCSPHIGHO2_01_FULL_39_17]|uniref:Uncharacterized protein n=3 Tax=Candidatus Woeseibacteriota TaxID=1752722 RepID=A0A0G0QTH1_9BACT|nr:MAG: hypothetical protein US72_C0012G0016 [Microgenomates group bacterium GW2011_GWC1_38_12]KKQ93483.1 MAG: hypothetical protein UT19_C0011G0028 [Candidatus Woesebacteria bacterium GW2011_GWB1_39_10b]KKR13645.1 MAG: hypothetical protein UT40_C0012G0011 [Candidatus Woesebacteria bacterium GW2011_GWA1_39_21b]OGM23242.1 MAG: hypothetical protein A2865_03250 [Candidatus Woesebacteria bacterium RIFCSPHIGHO2_01_FULL_39_17]OGM65694.1 MAG: hypothetical protein A3A52_05200 [Candidatus Woesebacteria b
MLSKSDFQQIQDIVRTEVHQETRKIIKEELAPIKKDITQIRKDIKTIVNFFDREYLELRKRVERIEEHLGLESISP